VQSTRVSKIVIRRGEVRDLPKLTEIYNHYVVSSPATFDLEPYTLDRRRPWFEPFATRPRYKLFVAVGGDARQVQGYAASMRFRPKAAYDATVETTIYLAPECTGRGLGRELYQTLFEALEREDIHLAVGGITLPNPSSIALHEAFGFQRMGVFKEVGRKLGQYWDVAWYEKYL